MVRNIGKICNKIIYPFWKLIPSSSLMAIYGILTLIRDDIIPEKYQHILRLVNLINMFAWYWWVIISLILFVILKANDIVKTELKIENNNKKRQEIKDEIIKLENTKKNHPITLKNMIEIAPAHKEIDNKIDNLKMKLMK
jgi:hypothetical protein